MKDIISEKNEIIKMLQENRLYIVQKSDFEELVKVTGEAYIDYPLHVHFFGGKNVREGLEQIMRVNLYSMYDEGIIYADSKDLNGFAIFLPPGFKGTNTLPFIWNGGFKIIFAQGIKSIKIMANFESFAMAFKKKYTNHQDWYCYNLCVKQSAQGKKISSKIMKPILNYFKLNNKLCYLETNIAANVPVYKHFGFKVMEKAMVPNSNVEHYAMLFNGKE